MSKEAKGQRQLSGGVQELERRLITISNMVESLFADSLIGLVEPNPATLELRAEDCRAHEQCLEIDKLCTELLTNGGLSAQEVRFTSAAIKIAADLKRTADECLRIGEEVRIHQLDSASTTESLASIARMAELTQSMLSDGIEALINRDAAAAAGLYPLFQELASLKSQAVEELTERMVEEEIAIPLLATFLGVAQRLERIGDEVLDISNQVRHLYPRNQRA